ncbi:GNAT family N-acetyltransferase [Aneurinibacillus terranovensis]|uniref:GNAT family N-acetyltransferase n=1 Tax=Aneurinibacillus terranovensis TaxID=278991 RepID=UPI000419C430|nr:GNAT family N-acetyltransferase [Aneurinibacillus terranovensis]
MAAYHVKSADDAATLKKALAVRRSVFIEEQNVPEELELDEHDVAGTGTRHFIIANENGEAVAAARLRPYDQGMGKVERVAVLAVHRGKGLGRKIMEAVEKAAREEKFTALKLNAQISAQPFYEELGYQPRGEHFIDAGIEHIAMIKTM